MKGKQILAFDLGAESGRAVLGALEADRLHIRELRRFPNAPVKIHGSWRWNVYRLFEEMLRSLQQCAVEMGSEGLESIGVDTWGLDFGLFAVDGTLLGLPHTYRDDRTAGMMERLFERVPASRVYELTGIQFMPINTLYQLLAFVERGSPTTQCIADLLFIPDIFNYLLTGERCTEFTYATTSQLYNPHKGDWEDELFAALGMSKTIMQRVVPPATVIGDLSASVVQGQRLKAAQVIAPATHDTASAVASTPAAGDDWAYISSGTWSLMGIEVPTVICTDLSQKFNFTNEGGVSGTFRLLKNVMGLWLVQECRTAWRGQSDYDYITLTEMASRAAPFGALIDPNCPDFLNPPDMPAAICRYCEQTGQPPPASIGETVRCILESLALEYRRVLGQLRLVHSRPIRTIHIVGGGAQNQLLCQFTANATGLPVLAGPSEATASGNILVQAMGLGYVDSLWEIRELVRRSFDIALYEPRDTARWNSAYGHYLQMLEADSSGTRPADLSSA